MFPFLSHFLSAFDSPRRTSASTLQCKALCMCKGTGSMSVFDLLFIVVFLATIVTLLVAAVAAVRGRGRRAMAIMLRLGVFAGTYLGVVILVSLVSPRRVLNVGDDLCWDDW